jgi:CheY-like chemotaxis protein
MRAETLLRQVPGAQGLCVSGVDAVKEVVRSLNVDEPYHIIFVDHNLQGTSPTQLAEALHKIENCKPLLLLTTDIYETGIKSAGYFRSFSRAQQTRWLQLLQEAWDKWSSQSGQESRKKEKLRVLMIEDEPLTKKVAASLLSEQFDCDITTASFGQEALEKFGPNFDVVFLDIVLPDMDGFEVAKHMQARMSAENFSVPIIAMTVYEENEMGLDRMKAAGIAAVATKPIEMHFLKALVEKFVFKEAVLG